MMGEVRPGEWFFGFLAAAAEGEQAVAWAVAVVSLARAVEN